MNDKVNIEESLDISDIELSEMEDALKLMEQSEELTDEEIVRLLQDDSCMKDTKDLFAIKKAIDKKNAHVPDPDMEWLRLQLNDTTARRFVLKPSIKYITAAAAVLLLAFVFTWNRQKQTADEFSGKYVVYKANDAARDIVITSDQGNSVVFNKQNISKLGSEVSQTDELTIAYNQLNSNIIESHTVTIPEGKTFRILLSDGSTVWLNAGSRLVYPTRFAGSSREVQLDGEAYFMVSPDATHPFIVKSGDIYTRVLGTEFNIRMKKNTDTQVHETENCEITLVKGKVSVYSKGNNNDITLIPGMQAVFEANSSTFNIKEVDTDLYSYWKDGYFFFDDEPLENMMKQIGSWYNVNIVFRNPDFCKIKMHFFCERDCSIQKIVEQLNMLQKVHATVNNNTIFID